MDVVQALCLGRPQMRRRGCMPSAVLLALRLQSAAGASKQQAATEKQLCNAPSVYDMVKGKCKIKLIFSVRMKG